MKQEKHFSCDPSHSLTPSQLWEGTTAEGIEADWDPGEKGNVTSQFWEFYNSSLPLSPILIPVCAIRFPFSAFHHLLPCCCCCCFRPRTGFVGVEHLGTTSEAAWVPANGRPGPAPLSTVATTQVQGPAGRREGVHILRPISWASWEVPRHTACFAGTWTLCLQWCWSHSPHIGGAKPWPQEGEGAWGWVPAEAPANSTEFCLLVPNP